MQQHEILNKRNLLTLITYIFSSIIFIIVIFSQQFQHHPANIIFCSGSIVFLIALYFLKVPPRAYQFIVICNWHVLAFLFNFQSINHITFYAFIYIIAVLSIYRSIRISFINIVLVLIEIFTLYKCSIFSMNLFGSQESDLFFSFLLVICIVSLAQGLFIKRIWLKVEKKAIDREYVLNSKQAYLSLFFEQARDAIAVFDLQDRVIAVNPAFEKLYGWSKEEAIGKFLPLVPPENVEGAKQRANDLRQGKSYHLFETNDMRKDGTVFDAQISMSPIFNPHGEIIASSVISRDISYIKENENLIVQSEKLKLIGELAAGVAHEIRNPMTVISGYVQMMNEEPDSPYYEYTKLIQNETERIELILSEFLVLSRPQANPFIAINLAETLKEVAQFFQIEFQQKTIELHVKNDYPNTFILGNKNQIKQVFINLFKNAIEAIHEDGTIMLELCKSKDGKEIFIRIEDTGCGMPPHVLHHIFEPFYTTKTKGTGLGMMIINKIMLDHNGTIKIKSEQNVGTEIILTFPVKNE